MANAVSIIPKLELNVIATAKDKFQCPSQTRPMKQLPKFSDPEKRIGDAYDEYGAQLVEVAKTDEFEAQRARYDCYCGAGGFVRAIVAEGGALHGRGGTYRYLPMGRILNAGVVQTA